MMGEKKKGSGRTDDGGKVGAEGQLMGEKGSGRRGGWEEKE